MKPLIPGYPVGSDITIMDARYHYPRKDEQTGKWSKDTMTIIYKDNKTGKKKQYTIYEPKYTYYFCPQDPGYHRFFLKKNQLVPITCKYRELMKSMAEQIGALDVFYDNIKSGNRKENTKLFRDRRFFESDIPINDYYRMMFTEEYKNDICKVSKAFLDIETDIIDIKGRFPLPGECPINAVSYLDFDSKHLVTFLLDDPNRKNAKLDLFKKNLNQKKLNNDVKNLVAYALGGEDRLRNYQLDELTTEVVMYTDEIKMLVDLFRYINSQRPDFILAWNMGFDVPYIIERIRKLGYDPAQIMSDPDFTLKVANYVRDDENYNEPEKRKDFADISSYSIYLDQLIQFASRRKGQSVYTNMKLDYIGDKVAGMRKLDYSDICTDLADLPYMDYETFVKYNMCDVIVQYCIEFETEDVEYVFAQAIMNATEYKKVHRQTTYLANRAVMRFKAYGNYILGNNDNKFQPKPTDKYDGAFVSDPLNVSYKPKKKIYGLPVMVADNSIDFDYTSLYPSITRQLNLAPNTLIGKIVIPERIYAGENSLHNPKYTRASEFAENLLSDNFIEFMHRWFGLGSFEEVYQDILEYYSKYEYPMNVLSNSVYHQPLQVVQVFDDKSDKLMNVVEIIDPNRNMKTVDTLTPEQEEKINKMFNREELK